MDTAIIQLNKFYIDKEYKKARNLCKIKIFKYKFENLYNNLGVIYFKLKSFNKSFYYLKKSLNNKLLARIYYLSKYLKKHKYSRIKSLMSYLKIKIRGRPFQNNRLLVCLSSEGLYDLPTAQLFYPFKYLIFIIFKK